jgi:putative membrane protein insertion efficiency factor
VNVLSRIAARTAILAVRAYQLTIAPWLPPSCRFVPSCSAYMIEAIRVHGPWRGVRLGLGRLLRCRPLSPHGFDPVPPAAACRSAARDESAPK